MTWLLGLWGKTKVFAAASLVGVALVAAALLRARLDGKNAAEMKQTKARQRLQEKYDEVNRQNVDVDAAYDRLGKLSDDKGKR